MIKTIREWERTRENEDSAKAASEADSFLYYYDIFTAQLMRGDSYRAFFHYNLSSFKLATVLVMSSGITECTYAPPWLTNLLGKENTYQLRKISSGLFPAQVVLNKKRF